MGDDKISLSISGDIGDDWGGENTTIEQVMNWNGITNSTKEIEIKINTNGGDVNHGVAIYNYFKNHPAKIKTTIMGGAHSAGSIIFLAGEEREMPSGTTSLVSSSVDLFLWKL